MNGLLFVLLLLVAIGLHEFGHFATAKRFGMKVDRFFIGFGPRIWSTRRGETEYGLAWIPAGGYVRIAGMNPFETVPEADRERTFKAKKPWQRAVVLAAGSTMHFIVAFVTLAALLMTAGLDEPSTVADAVEKGAPAAQAGLLEGDRIVAVDGLPVLEWPDVRNYVRARPGARVTIDVDRGGRRETIRATLGTTNPEGEPVGFLGVYPALEPVRRDAPAAVVESVKVIGVGMRESLIGLGKIVSPSTIKHLFGVAAGNEKRTEDDPASIVGITRLAGSLGLVGLLYQFVAFNIFIGVANLMPLPPLDGGHLAVLAYERVRGRDVDMRRLIPVTATVLAVLIGLFMITLYLDIVSPIRVVN